MRDDVTPGAGPGVAEDSGRDVTVATAGHVDHGKSTLIRVLTGTDPDRLPEERRREMTIELGFASIPRPAGGRIAFIDVPGHDRLVETMVSGSGSIDAALLVVAADDGPMPQTHEHLGILKLLGVEEFVVAITRIDLVDDDWLTLAIASTNDFLIDHGLDSATITPVSAISGAGLEELRARLCAVAPRLVAGKVHDAVWLPVDRAFHRHGFGTVVAGTLLRGRLDRGDIVALWPGGLSSTVRRLQSHNQPIESAFPGQRVALNLPGIGLDQVRRGNVLSSRPIPASETVDVRFRSVGPMPKSGEHVRVMVGTDRVDATIRVVREANAGVRDYCVVRLRFRRPVATVPGDRLIVRRPSPATTIGGGIVLARYTGRPPRLDADRRSELAALAEGDPEPTLRRRLAIGPISIESVIDGLPGSAMDIVHRWLLDRTLRPIAADRPADTRLVPTSVVITEDAWQSFATDLMSDLEMYHAENPESGGCPLTELRRRFGRSWSELDDLLGLAIREGHIVLRDRIAALPGHRPYLRPSERPVAEWLLRQLASGQSARVATVRDIRPTTVEFLVGSGAIVRIDDHRVMAAEEFGLVALWVIEMSRPAPLDLATARDWIGLGRDTVQRLLERFDQMGLTVLHGDGRRPGPAADGWVSSRTARRTQPGGAPP